MELLKGYEIHHIAEHRLPIAGRSHSIKGHDMSSGCRFDCTVACKEQTLPASSQHAQGIPSQLCRAGASQDGGHSGCYVQRHAPHGAALQTSLASCMVRPCGCALAETINPLPDMAYKSCIVVSLDMHLHFSLLLQLAIESLPFHNTGEAKRILKLCHLLLLAFRQSVGFLLVSAA